MMGISLIYGALFTDDSEDAFKAIKDDLIILDVVDMATMRRICGAVHIRAVEGRGGFGRQGFISG